MFIIKHQILKCISCMSLLIMNQTCLILINCFYLFFVRSKYYKLLFFQTIQVKEVFMHSLGQRLANP